MVEGTKVSADLYLLFMGWVSQIDLFTNLYYGDEQQIFLEPSLPYLHEVFRWKCQMQQKHPLGDYDPHQKSTFAFYD